MKKLRTKENSKSDYVFSLVQKAINIVASLITVSLINRFLGVELKGEYEYIVNIVNVLAIVIGVGLYASYPYMKRLKEEHQRQKYLDAFFLQSLIYTVIAIIIAVIARNEVLNVALVLLITKVMSTQFENVGVVEFINYRQIVQILSHIVEMVVTILVCCFAPKNIPIVMMALISKHVFCIVLYLVRLGLVPHPFRVDRSFLKKTISYGVVAMLTVLMSEFNYNIDVIIMGLFCPYSEIGLYSVGSKLAQYAWLVPDSFKEVLFSRVSKDDSVEEIKPILRLNMTFSYIVILVMALFGKGIIYLLFGAEYVAAYAVTVVVCLGVPSMVLYKILNPLYQAKGQQKKLFGTLSLSVLINVVLNFIMIPIFGKMGAAVSTVVSYTACGIMLYIDFVRAYHVKWRDGLFIKKDDVSIMAGFLKKKVLKK